MSDPYVYPGTDILINKYSIEEQKPLHKIEGMLTGRRLLELMKNPIDGEFDLKHLQKIHKYIFQDLYSWAGEIRTTNISNGNDFAHHMVVGMYFEESVSNSLKKTHYLREFTTKSVFVEKLAYYFDHVNAAHPFRDGNGRAQREFFRILALKNNFQIDWSYTTAEEMIGSSIQSLVKNDNSGIKQIFLKCIRN
jgi:cell filamentation protein